MIKTNSSKSGPLLWFIAIPESSQGCKSGLLVQDSAPKIPIRAGYLRRFIHGFERNGSSADTTSDSFSKRPPVIAAARGESHPTATENPRRHILKTGPAIHVNFSHTRGALLCGLSDVSPLGVDLENIQRKVRFEKLQERCFTRAENGWIAEASNLEDGFFRAWTLKEAYLKATGLGIRIELKDLKSFQAHQVQSASPFEVNPNRIVPLGPARITISVYLGAKSRAPITSEKHSGNLNNLQNKTRRP